MKQMLIVGVVGALMGSVMGGALVYHYKPRTITKTEMQTNTVIQNHVVTVTKTVKEPNGAVESVSTMTDNTVHTEKEDEIKVKDPLWHISAGAQTGLTFVPAYSLQVERRIAGPLFIGARAQTDGVVGLTLGLEF